jgi:hypothetical protein
MREVLRVMKETQCISRTAIGESGTIDERGTSLEGVANLWWDHHIGISRVTNPDRHLAGNKFPVYTIIDEISCRGVKSSRSHSRLDAVKSGEGSGTETETKHERRLITGEMRTGCLLNCESGRV